MKGILVYDTSYGNTKKVAETIAESLKESGLEVDLFSLKDVGKFNSKDYGFIVLGSPTRFGTMSFAMRSFVGRLKSEEWANKPFASFDTENPENEAKKQSSAGEKIVEKLKEKGMKQQLPVLKSLVHDQKGPLLDGEVDKAKNWAKQLTTELKK